MIEMHETSCVLQKEDVKKIYRASKDDGGTIVCSNDMYLHSSRPTVKDAGKSIDGACNLISRVTERAVGSEAFNENRFPCCCTVKIVTGKGWNYFGTKDIASPGLTGSDR